MNINKTSEFFSILDRNKKLKNNRKHIFTNFYYTEMQTVKQNCHIFERVFKMIWKILYAIYLTEKY